MPVREMIPLFDGSIRGNRIARFTRSGVTFDVIRPGYDAKGRRRHTWTQFVFEGVPVFEVKKNAEFDGAMDRFDNLWKQHIGDDHALLMRALNAAKTERLSKFRDGRTGEIPAPALTVDGRGEGKRYPS